MSELSALSLEQRLNLVADAADDQASMVLDPDGLIVDWTASAERLLGWTAADTKTQSSVILFIHDDNPSAQNTALLEKARENGKCVSRRWQERKDGTGFHAEDRTYALYGETHALLGFGKIIRDVSAAIDIPAQGLAEATERATAERLKFVMEAGRIGDWDLDLVNDIAYRSLIHDQCFGYPDGAPYWGFNTFIDHVHPDDQAWVQRDFQAAIDSMHDMRIECRVIWPDDSTHWILAQGRVYGAKGHPIRMTGMVQDVTSRKIADQQVLHASLHDPLTDLPNRAKLFEYAEHLLAHNQRTEEPATVFFMDLDRFKRINDTHGHAVGDALLREVASRLRNSVRVDDFIVRLGGDEFLILFQDIYSTTNAAALAKLIIKRISQPFHIGNLTLSLSTSIGISMFPTDGSDIDTLTTHADLAMYQAKQGGRNNFHFFSSELAAGNRLTRVIEQHLRTALAQGEFHLAYQPVIDLQSGELVSVEALLRWKETDIGPEQFVPIAESTGLIGSIGRWLLDEAASQYVTWQNHGLPALPIAINVSVIEFRDHQFIDRFQYTLDQYGLGPEALQLELTETAVMDDIEQAIAQLNTLRKKGVVILLDDFGTGQSSLTYLARLPVKTVKIDKSFVTNLNQNRANRTVTEAMVALAHSLGLGVVAEGIETEELLDYVRSRGCQQGQGFYLGQPMSGAAFEAWHREHLQNRLPV